MSKKSSYSPGDKRPGGESNRGKSTGSRPYKDAKPFKKKYDGRAPGKDGDERPARPYSGRTTGTPFKKDDADRKSRSGDEKPFDRAKRPYEDKRKSFDKPAFKRDESRGRDDRKPRSGDDKPFDSAKRRYEDKRKPFDKPAFKRDDNKDRDDRKPRSGDDKPFEAKRPYEDRRKSFDKPAFKRDDNRDDRKPRSGDDKPFDRPKRPYEDKRKSFDKPAFKRNEDKDRDDRKPRSGDDKPFDRPKRPYGDKRKPFDKPAINRDESKGDDRKPRSAGDSRPFRDRPKPPYKAGGRDKPGVEKTGKERDRAIETEERKFDSVLKNAFNGPKKKVDGNDPVLKPEVHEDKVFGELQDPVREEKIKRLPVSRKTDKKVGADKTPPPGKKGRRKKHEEDEEEDENSAPVNDGMMPLNKFIAHSGECSRRDAAELVKQGKVKVNGELILDPGHKVHVDANVTLVGKKLKPQRDNVYILLNKPKGYITTNEDPQGRKTVMDLVTNSGADRIFPVGRLDRDTSGLLLITNDGDLTQKLSHPSFRIKKVYHVTLDKALTKAHFEKIVEGVELEDGVAVVDELAYLEAKNELGLEIHSGKNRIVRRIFESLGYVVDKLDRMMYAGLTKKNLPRGKWRFLDPREVILLKHFKS